MRISDWSSDVCSSDLQRLQPPLRVLVQAAVELAGIVLAVPAARYRCVEVQRQRALRGTVDDGAVAGPAGEHDRAGGLQRIQPVDVPARVGERLAAARAGAPAVAVARLRAQDRKRVVWGKIVSVSGSRGGRR